jgi:hypothetical protein
VTRRALAALALLLFLATVPTSAARAQSATAALVTDGIAPLADDSRLRLRLVEAGLRVGVPVPLTDRDVLVVGGGYDLLIRRYYLDDTVRFAGVPEPRGRFLDRTHLDAPLHDAGLGVLYGRVLSRGWFIYGATGVSYAGDFHAVDLADVRRFLALGAAVRLHPTFRLRFGAFAVDARRPALISPFVGWEWRPVSWFHSEARLPRRLDLTFVFLDRVEAALFAAGEGREYHVREGGLGFDRLRFVEVRAGVSLGLRIAGDLWLSVQGGLAPYRLLSGRDGDDDEVWGGPMQSTWFARVALDLRTGAGRPDAGLDVLP